MEQPLVFLPFRQLAAKQFRYSGLVPQASPVVLAVKDIQVAQIIISNIGVADAILTITDGGANVLAKYPITVGDIQPLVFPGLWLMDGGISLQASAATTVRVELIGFQKGS